MADPQTPLADLSGPELEQALIDLGRQLAYPVTPDLAGGVRARLEGKPAARRAALTPAPLLSSRERGLRLPSPDAWGEGLGMRGVLWLAAILLLFAFVAGLALFPQARQAIADRLGLPGVVIRLVEEVPAPPPAPVGEPLTLGRAVTLAEAQAEVDFPILVPALAGFDAPPEIYLLGPEDGAMVSFVYPAAPGLPESDVTGIGALLTQFPGEADRRLIEKGLPADGAAAASRLEALTVAGEPGFWISGAPHAFFFVCYDVGECRQERYRLAGNVLLWERDGLTLRLESALSRDEAIAIAESVRSPR